MSCKPPIAGKSYLRDLRNSPKFFMSWLTTVIRVEGCGLEAYILINTDANALWSVAEAALRIEGVKMAHAVTGQFDSVVLVEFPKMDNLGKIIDKIQHLEGVHRTQTLIAIPPPIRE
jgi:DNA-binding Lrp family transcriptional regulator